MKRWRKALLWFVCGAGMLVVAAFPYFAWEDVLFIVKFRRLGELGTEYVLPSLRNELAGEALALENWFLARGEFSLSRLRSRLGSAERHEKLAALHLLWKVQSDRGVRLDLEDFWRAFEDRQAVEKLLGGRLDAILSGGASGIHRHEETGVVLLRFQGEDAVLWRIKADQRGTEKLIEAQALRSLKRRQGQALPPAARIEKTVLAGGESRRLKLDIARALCLGSFPEFPTEHARNRYCFVAEAGRLFSYFYFTGWQWLDMLADHYASLAEAPPGDAAEAATDAEKLDFLLTVVEGSPWDVGVLDALSGIVDLELSPLELEAARSRLRSLPPSAWLAHKSVLWVPAALHLLGDSSAVQKIIEQGSLTSEQVWSLACMASARPEGVLPAFLRREGMPQWMRTGLEWKLAGLALDVFGTSDAAWLAEKAAGVSPDQREMFLQGALQNRKACFHPVVIQVLRRAPAAVRTAYLDELAVAPPSEDTEEAWARLLDTLEQTGKAAQ